MGPPKSAKMILVRCWTPFGNHFGTPKGSKTEPNLDTNFGTDFGTLRGAILDHFRIQIEAILGPRRRRTRHLST